MIMKTLLKILTLAVCVCLCPSVSRATLSATVTPGYQFGSSEVPTIATLNQLGQPSILISGTVDGSTGLTPGSVNGALLADSVVDGLTTAYNGSSPRAIYVLPGGLVNTNAIVVSGGYLSLLVDTNYFRLATNSIANSNSISSTGNTNWITLKAGTLTDTNLSTNAAINPNKLALLSYSLLGSLGGSTNGLSTGTATNILIGSSLRILTETNQSGAWSNVVQTLEVNTNRMFTSGLFSFTNNGTSASAAHGLGLTNAPRTVRWVLVNQTAEAGYSPGAEIDAATLSDTSHNNFTRQGADATNVWFVARSTAAAVEMINLTNSTTTTAASSGGVLSNWKLKAYVWP